jgi:hypothetical protein
LSDAIDFVDQRCAGNHHRGNHTRMLSLKFHFYTFLSNDSVLISIDARDRDESHLDQVCQWIEEAEDGHDNLALTWADMMNDLKCGVAQNLPLSSSLSAEGNKH